MPPDHLPARGQAGRKAEHNPLQQVATEAPEITKLSHLRAYKVTSERQPEDEQGGSQELDLKLVKEAWSTSLHQLMKYHLINWQSEDEQEDGPLLELKQVEETRNLNQVTHDTHELDPIS